MACSSVTGAAALGVIQVQRPVWVQGQEKGKLIHGLPGKAACHALPAFTRDHPLAGELGPCRVLGCSAPGQCHTAARALHRSHPPHLLQATYQAGPL